MKVVVTGGAGFLGRLLVESLLGDGLRVAAGALEPVREVVVVDVVAPPGPADPRVGVEVGDIAEPGFLASVVDADTDVVFHLAAVVSGQAEVDFDLGMRVNLDGSRLLLDACRATGRRPLVVFSSSLAVYGGPLPAVVDDTTVLTPASSYGAQKAAAELLLADHTRKGFVDGRAFRLPTVTVRPGRPNRAASSFLSGIIREPVAGVAAVCPVQAGTRVWLISPDRAVQNLVAGAGIASNALGPLRAVNLPGVSVTVGEMVETLRRTVGASAASLVRWEPDPEIERLVGSWPSAVDTTRARALGLGGDSDFEEILQQYLRRHGRP